MRTEKENKKQLETFFREEYQSMKGYINARIKASTDRDAEDVIQDVALKLFSMTDTNSRINNVAGFVYRSLKNKIIDVMRKRKNTIFKEETELNTLEFMDLPTDTNNVYTERMKVDLAKSIGQLKAPYRAIIIAVDMEGYSYKEIAFQTGIPEGTLMSRRHRAIAQLHKQLENKKN